MKRNTRVPTPRCGARLPRKVVLTSLAMELLESSARIEPVAQEQIPHGTTSASGSQMLMVPSSEVPTSVVPFGPTLPASTVPPAVPLAVYLAPPPTVPTAFPAPLPPASATTYSAPAPVVPVAPAYTLHAVPLVVLAPAYPAVTLVIPALVVPSVPAMSSAHPIDIIAARTWIPTLAESVKN
ncbi:proline-rich receptor-like protein kinase PERK2 [Zingiber officinale]|uniref:proline-rich receptor-like protein kinase PERK2 n=1 Tax=Zingiber officinale TaxID=94328 RepID=UPI001C4C18C2|nr:proline-rich receptor-like protein kinase PERK2 [Zingiber officinale]